MLQAPPNENDAGVEVAIAADVNVHEMTRHVETLCRKLLKQLLLQSLAW